MLFYPGCGSVWQSARFGTERPAVQIRPSRPNLTFGFLGYRFHGIVRERVRNPNRKD